MPSKTLATVVVFGAMLALAPAAHADHVKPNLGLEVTSADAATRTVQGIQHCVADGASRRVSLKVARDIDFGQFRPGVVTGVAVDASGVILSSGSPPCDIQAGQDAPAGQTEGAKARKVRKARRGADQLRFSRSFLRRVWKFRVEIGDVAAPGQLAATFRGVVNLPKGMRSQDDALIGQAGVVVLTGPLSIHRDGKPGPMGDIAKLKGDAVVTGKMLPRSRWETGEDGEAVPTVRVREVNLKS